jgi:hypothetical protein
MWQIARVRRSLPKHASVRPVHMWAASRRAKFFARAVATTFN